MEDIVCGKESSLLKRSDLHHQTHAQMGLRGGHHIEDIRWTSLEKGIGLGEEVKRHILKTLCRHKGYNLGEGGNSQGVLITDIQNLTDARNPYGV